MTLDRDRDLDPAIRAWLDLMPDEAPEPALLAVQSAVRSAHQVGRTRRLADRLSTSRGVRVTLAASIVLMAAIGLASGRIGGMFQPVGNSLSERGPRAIQSNAPGPVESPSGSFGAQMPEFMRFKWVAAPPLGASAGGTGRRDLAFDAWTMVVGSSGGAAGQAMFTVEIEGSQLTLRSPDAAPCRRGATGSYRWSLSGDGLVLSIGSADDQCSARTALVPGIWYRSGCADGGSCLGPLAAGRHASQFIDPRARATAGTARWDAIDYQVPPGWANAEDTPLTLRLTPVADYANESGGIPPTGHRTEVDVFAQPAAAATGNSCGTPSADPAVGRTAAALATWLQTAPGTVTTAGGPAQIDGFSGWRFHVALDPSWHGVCPEGPAPGREPAPWPASRATLFVDSPTGGQMFRLGLVGTEQMDIVILDIGRGDVVLIATIAASTDDLDALSPEAASIVASLRFH